MATITKGLTFGSTETVTNTKLHTLVDSASIAGIVNADVSAGAAIDASKLDLTGSGFVTTGENFTITGIYTYSTAPVLPADTIDAITEIKSTLKSGTDATLITGTKGTNDNLASWNADGDLVDSSKSTSDLTQSFGSWASKSNNTIYQAATDGFVTAYSPTAGTVNIYGYTDSSSSPTTLRLYGKNTVNSGADAITFPVKKDDYWKVVGASTVYWIPLS